MSTFYSKETWNTLWTLANSKGKFISYVMGLMCLRILYGPMYLGVNFPFIPNLNICFHRATFRNTLSLGAKLKGSPSNVCIFLLSILCCIHSILNDPHFFSANLHQLCPIQLFVPDFFPTQGCPTLSAIKSFKWGLFNCCLITVIVREFY